MLAAFAKQKVKSNLTLNLCLITVLFVANKIRINISNLKIGDYSSSELLINYQGGFVRRGIFGEIVYHTSSPIHFATLLQKGALVFVLVGILAIIFFEKSNFARVALTITFVFAPGGLEDLSVGGAQGEELFEYLDRKEIWFYVALIVFYFCIKLFNHKPLLVSLIFTPTAVVVILHHELFIIFALPIFTVWLISKRFNFRSLDTLSAVIFYVSLSTTFYLVTKFHGNQQTADLILQSYQNKFPGLDINGKLGPTEGALPAIGWDIEQSHQMAIRIVNLGSTLYYIFFAVMAVALVKAYLIIKFNKLVHLLLALSLSTSILIGCLVITYVFMDIGRLISMYTFSTLIGAAVLSQSLQDFEKIGTARFLNSRNLNIEFQSRALYSLFAFFLIFTALITRVEHSNPQPNQIPFNSFFGILK